MEEVGLKALRSETSWRLMADSLACLSKLRAWPLEPGPNTSPLSRLCTFTRACPLCTLWLLLLGGSRKGCDEVGEVGVECCWSCC